MVGLGQDRLTKRGFQALEKAKMDRGVAFLLEKTGAGVGQGEKPTHRGG